MFPLRLSFFSQLNIPVHYGFSHKPCFLVLLSSLLLSAVLSPIVLPFHQALCVKLDIVLMLGFRRELNYQNILQTYIFLFSLDFYISHLLGHLTEQKIVSPSERFTKIIRSQNLSTICNQIPGIGLGLPRHHKIPVIQLMLLLLVFQELITSAYSPTILSVGC